MSNNSNLPLTSKQLLESRQPLTAYQAQALKAINTQKIKTILTLIIITGIVRDFFSVFTDFLEMVLVRIFPTKKDSLMLKGLQMIIYLFLVVSIIYYSNININILI